MSKFKISDWCFYQYNLCQVKKAGRSYDLTDGVAGYGLSQSYENEILPLTLNNLTWSTNFKYYEERIRKVEGNANINWPRIKNWLVTEWLNCCKDAEYYADSRFEERLIKLVESIKDLQNNKFEGIPLLRE